MKAPSRKRLGEVQDHRVTVEHSGDGWTIVFRRPYVRHDRAIHLPIECAFEYAKNRIPEIEGGRYSVGFCASGLLIEDSLTQSKRIFTFEELLKPKSQNRHAA